MVLLACLLPLSFFLCCLFLFVSGQFEVYRNIQSTEFLKSPFLSTHGSFLTFTMFCYDCMCMGVGLHAGLHNTCAPGALEARRCWIPWDWSSRGSWTTLWILGIEPGPLEKQPVLSAVELSLQLNLFLINSTRGGGGGHCVEGQHATVTSGSRSKLYRNTHRVFHAPGV